MTFPVPGGRLTAGFDQMRPLSVPMDQRTHVHGAIDIAAAIGTPIIAPEAGMLHYFAAFRPDHDRTMGEFGENQFPFYFMGRPYFYDIYGALILVLGKSGHTHIFAHSFLNHLFNAPPHRVKWKYDESPAFERFPLTAFFTTNGYGHHISEGATIGSVGNAGYSTGPHVHYEMHKGRLWQEHAKRPRPTDYFEMVIS